MNRQTCNGGTFVGDESVYNQIELYSKNNQNGQLFFPLESDTGHDVLGVKLFLRGK